MRKALVVLAVLSLGVLGLAQQSRLDVVLERGKLICGVNGGAPGFGYINEKTGSYEGFDVDFCKAVAAALFDDPNKVEYVALTAKVRFNAIQTGKVDVVFRNTTVTTSRDGSVGVDFLPVNFYDGQGVMVRKDLGVTSVFDLKGATVCTNQGTTTEKNWTDIDRAHNLGTKLITFEDFSRSFDGLLSGRCDAITTDKSGLVGWKAKAPNPDELVILPETLSKEPLAGFTFQNDSKWRDALTWIVYATMQAEEFGITQDNLDEMLKSDNPGIRRFLGLEGTLGEGLGLSNDFVVRIIRHVGNYGEIYDRHLGPNSPFFIPREGSLNAPYTEGGLIYSPPFR